MDIQPLVILIIYKFLINTKNEILSNSNEDNKNLFFYSSHNVFF